MKRYLLACVTVLLSGAAAHAQGCPTGDGSPQAYAQAVACQRALLNQGRIMREQQADYQRQVDEQRAAQYRANLAEEARRERLAGQQRQQAANKRQADIEQARASQLAREQSPDNHCAETAFAGEMLNSLNEMMRKRSTVLEIIDAQHLTTENFVPERSVVACHGVFIYSNGTRVAGTYSTRLNVAGTTITSFKAD